MATKSGNKEEKQKKTFKRLNFWTEDMPGCCGIQVVANFQEAPVEYDYGDDWMSAPKRKYPRPLFATKKEQIDDLYERVVKATDSPCLLISLVSRWNQTEGKDKQKDTAQLPELADKLLEEGWEINQVFINPVHGNNEVTLYSKTFPERQEDKENGDQFLYNSEEAFE